MSGEIGKCELCERESNQAWDDESGITRGHVLCTSCQEILEQEMLELKDDEPVGRAYVHARRRCKLIAKIKKLRAEKESLENEVAQLKSTEKKTD